MELHELNPSIGASNMQPVSWVVALGLVFSFGLAAAMGANDMANAFGTSVGAKVLTLRQAAMIATVFSLAGALSLGAGVTKTIASKIVHVDVFDDEPAMYMVGMFCSLIASAFSVALATRYGLPISTTHAIIGAVVGFSLAEGRGGVQWWPNMGKIFASWIISPILSGLVSAVLYVVTRQYVFRAKSRNLERQRLLSSVFVGLCAALVSIFVGFRETEKKSESFWSWLVPLISLIVWALVGIFSFYVIVPFVLHHKRSRGFAFFPLATEVAPSQEDGQQDPAKLNGSASSTSPAPSTSIEMTPLSSSAPGESPTTHTSEAEQTSDRQGPAESESSTANAGENAVEENDRDLESNFKFLQVITASYMSFSHGANDIGNAAGPFVAIWSTYTHGDVEKNIDVNYWVISLSSLGLVIGLLFFGSKVVDTLGTNMTHITPSRGFSVELGVSLSVVLASFLGLPVSTTQCAVGSVVGVALMNPRGYKTVKWSLFGNIVLSWFCTLPIAGGLSAVLYLIARHLAHGVNVPPNSVLVICTGNCTFH